MSNAVSRVLERRSLRRAVQRALESGTGLYHTSWRLDDPLDERIADEVIDWCREALSKTHRPYGVGSVSVALAILGPDGRARASSHYPLLSPGDFYEGGSFEADLRAACKSWGTNTRLLGIQESRLSIVLFSWGDLTRELLLAS